MALTKSEIANIKERYPDFKLISIGDNGQELVGNLYLNVSYNDFTMNEQFRIKIAISKEYPIVIPKVYELSGKIAETYHHIYGDRELCLGIDSEIMLNCKGKLTIEYLIIDYIIPYLFSYKYYERFGVFPYGERSHGAQGIKEFFTEIFNVHDLADVKFYIEQLIRKPYRGHLPCVCGSGLKSRNCHSLNEELLSIINSRAMQQNLALDLLRIYQEEKINE
ncbi:MAG: hypothetical protein MJA82_07935 [Clostridia bacterium]|nr:hypothetical protein [Clostridia bacterium]